MPRLSDDRPLSSGPTRRDKSGPPPAYPPTRGCARKRNLAAFARVNLGERFGYSGAGDDLGLPALETLIGHEWSQIGVGIDLVDHCSAPDDRMVAATKFDPANVERAPKLRRKAVRANRVMLFRGDCVRHLVMIAGLDHPGIVHRYVLDNHSLADAPGAPFCPQRIAVPLGALLHDQQAAQRRAAFLDGR